jgi:outer membrane protein TolC
MFLRIALFLISLSVSFSTFADEQELTLEQCYQLLLVQSESLGQKAEAVKAAEASYREAVSFVYPHLNLGASQRVRSSESFGFSQNDIATEGTPGGGMSSGGRSIAQHPFETSITLQQLLFSGFRELHLSRAAQSEIGASQYDLARSRELLYLDLADVYHQILWFQGDLTILDRTKKVLLSRIGELNHFISLGRSRESEILAAQSGVADLDTSVDQIRGLLAASREMMAFLIGRPVGTFKLSTVTAVIPVESLDRYLSRAQERFDFRAAEKRRESVADQVVASEREHWPELRFEGNYYPYLDPDTNKEWDVFIRMQVPIFDGGAIDARTEQQRARLRSQELAVRETQRAADREVRIAYQRLIATQAQLKSVDRLLTVARKNYDAQRHDYELGIVTNLDVLGAIREVHEAERRLSTLNVQARIQQVQLEVAAGGLAT